MEKNKSIISKLSDEEKQLVEILIRIVKVADDIYQEQINPDYPGGNLYPHDITREEFDQAAIKDPELRRFDTVVERTSASTYKAVPYNQKYKRQCQRIIDLLHAALSFATEPSFRVYLKAMIDCFEEGTQESYRHMVSAWVKTKDYHINFPLGYDELYVDRLMGLKGTFDTALFVEDKELTPLIVRPIKMRKEFVKTLDLPGEPYVYPSLSPAVYWTLAVGGMSADMKARAWNTPDDPQARMEAGARQIVIRETISEMFETELKPILKETGLCSGQNFTDEQLHNGIFWTIAIHEVCHNIGNYKDYKNLEKYGAVFEELKNYILPIIWLYFCNNKKVCALGDVKAAVCAYLGSSLSGAVLGEKIRARESYTVATLLHFNFMHKNGALEVDGSKLTINFGKLVDVNRKMFREIIDIIERGSYEGAQRYVKLYGDKKPWEEVFAIVRKYTKTDV